MQPPIHLAISWLVGHRLAERRDRRLVTWPGVLPDLDAVSLLFGAGAYSTYHHVITHGILAAVAIAAAWSVFARDKLKTALLSLVAFHIHLLCDLVGSGAQGEPWPITYLWPFSNREIMFTHGWDLASPQNAFVWLAAVGCTIWIAVTQGRTFAEAFLPARADAAVVATIRKLVKRLTGKGESAVAS
jgi:hypothetical protein